MNLNTRSDRVYMNNAIRSPKVLTIDVDGKNLGILLTSEALRLASERGLDLVQMSPGNPPTAKIIDYGKFKYDQSKKQRQAEKKQRESEIKIKEIKFRPVTDSNDLKIKAKKAEEFLSDGAKVKLTIMFRGREFSHKEVAIDTLAEFMNLIPHGQIIGSPSVDGTKSLTVMIDKKEPEAKKASK